MHSNYLTKFAIRIFKLKDCFSNMLLVMSNLTASGEATEVITENSRVSVEINSKFRIFRSWYFTKLCCWRPRGVLISCGNKINEVNMQNVFLIHVGCLQNIKKVFLVVYKLNTERFWCIQSREYSTNFVHLS